MYKDFICIIKV